MEFFTQSTSSKFASFFGLAKNVIRSLDEEFTKVPGVKPWSRPNTYAKTEFVIRDVDTNSLGGYFNYVRPECVEEVKRLIEGLAGVLMTRITVRKRSTDDFVCVDFRVYDFTYEQFKDKYSKNKILWERMYSKWEPHMYEYKEEIIPAKGLFYAW